LSDLITCPTCEQQISSTAAKCPGCGEPMKVAPRLINCAACNQRVSNAAASCPGCGHPLSAELAPPVAPAQVFQPGVWTCQACRFQGAHLTDKKVAVVGWIVTGLLLLTGFGILFCWVGLLIREDHAICPVCKKDNGKVSRDALTRALLPGVDG
jgi:predicted amidophosphoribosyltransferase